VTDTPDVAPSFEYQGKLFSFKEEEVGEAYRIFLFASTSRVREFNAWRQFYDTPYSDPIAWLFFEEIIEMRNGMIFQKSTKINS
jgi:hypothetical protein